MEIMNKKQNKKKKKKKKKKEQKRLKAANKQNTNVAFKTIFKLS